MSDDRRSVTRRQKNSEDDDCPPPIPPQPSFTFAARRDASATPRHSGATPQQADAPVTPSEVKAQHGADSKKRPVAPPRNKSKKSTDDLSVVIAPADVTCGDVRSPDTANDEVFLAAEDAKTKVDSESVEDDDDDDAKMCRRDEPVDPQSVGSETVSDEARDMFLDQLSLPHHLPRTEETSDGVMAPGTVITSVTAPCQQVADSGVGTTSTGVVTGGRDDRLDKDSSAQLNTTSVHGAGNEAGRSLEQISNVRRPSQSSEQTQLSRVAPVIRFSEFDDFGLDPDLFRPDSIEEDVLFAEKTAKFTRSASPLYEPVIDDDETGFTSLSADCGL